MRILLTFVLLELIAFSAYSLSYSTAEGQIVQTMASCIEQYQAKYGELPTQWVELDEFLSRPLDEYFHYAPPTKRYSFVREFPLLPPIEGTIIAVARKPVYETTLSSGLFGIQTGLKGPGRYVIYMDDSGRCRVSWVKERYVEEAFASADQPLPVPDTEPDPIWISKARKEIALRWGIYVLLGTGFGIGFLFVFARLARWKPQ